MTADDIRLINTRTVNEDIVPNSGIRLFAENANIDTYIKEIISNFPCKEYLCEAEDYILGKVNESTKNNVLSSLLKQITELNGLPHFVKCKLYIKYMLTSNIDV